MLCPNCGTANAEGSRFCMGCGHELPAPLLSLQCANCGTANAVGSQFCMSCGHELSNSLPSPSDQPTTAAQAPAIVQPVTPTTSPSRPGKLLDGVDLLLALIGTMFGALASLVSQALVTRDAYLFYPFALTLVITGLTLVVSFSSIIPVAFGVFRNRAIQRKMKLRKLIQKEKVFFMSIEEDVSGLLRAGGKPYVR
jgi:hypothetical protein